MAADEWIWPVTRQTTGAAKPDVSAVEFEGYRQVAPTGNKESDKTINVVTDGMEQDELDACFAFLEQKNGQPFTWTYPVAPLRSRGQLSWTCNDYGWTHEGGLMGGIRATFRLFNQP